MAPTNTAMAQSWWSEVDIRHLHPDHCCLLGGLDLLRKIQSGKIGVHKLQCTPFS